MDIWDPLRKKNVALTPEEGVRQWFIGVLHEVCGYPFHLMRSEVAFSFGQEIGALEGSSRKRYRADVVVYEPGTLKPFIIVECKRPEVEITADVALQALRYISVLGAPWVVLTNGTRSFVYHKEEDGVFHPAPALPDYSNNPKE
ncbi:MAG: type I restriction enzyme HsdR N-terminal domain-containing protein [Bacteroidales bacterium]|nr:type I restriction enzyme HsdR N-terminal domain-containing protein [Bacteroidales bacterium]